MHKAIIGGSGFIGSRLTKRLRDAGEKVVIVDRRMSDFFPKITRIADVRDKTALRTALAGCDTVINLAAEHKDNVQPKSLYQDVNVGGAENICEAAEELGIERILFTSSVAVYGFAPRNTDETGELNPFNEYGRTKMEAEKVFRAWQLKSPSRTLVVVRPTVVFGERNRGNVYNLLRQMASGRFVMVGHGKNVKSMAYVENVAAFIEHRMNAEPGVYTYNYIDKPDLDMNTLVRHVNMLMGKKDRIGIRLPYVIGYTGGVVLDGISRLIGKEFPISAIRVKKFCSDTQFSSLRITTTGFVAPVPIRDALERTVRYEFIDKVQGVTFETE